MHKQLLVLRDYSGDGGGVGGGVEEGAGVGHGGGKRSKRKGHRRKSSLQKLKQQSFIERYGMTFLVYYFFLPMFLFLTQHFSFKFRSVSSSHRGVQDPTFALGAEEAVRYLTKRQRRMRRKIDSSGFIQ